MSAAMYNIYFEDARIKTTSHRICVYYSFIYFTNLKQQENNITQKLLKYIWLLIDICFIENTLWTISDRWGRKCHELWDLFRQCRQWSNSSEEVWVWFIAWLNIIMVRTPYVLLLSSMRSMFCNWWNMLLPTINVQQLNFDEL